MKIVELKEQMIKALINEWDDIIYKMDIADSSNNIHVIMVDGTKLVIHFKQEKGEAEIYHATLSSTHTIRDLYWGNLHPCNLDMDIPGYKKQAHEFIEKQNRILAYIPHELHEDLNSLIMLKAKIVGTEAEDSFVKGYQVATKLILESLFSELPEHIG